MRLNRIVVEGVGKRFGRRMVFAHVTAQFKAGEVVAITGRNGSGKSTLLRILAGLLSPTEGVVKGIAADAVITAREITSRTGFVAPYLHVYESFSAVENLRFIERARGTSKSASRIEDVIRRVGLEDVADTPVSTLSSGMAQRVRLASAILHDPDLLMLDEPNSNLDSAGRSAVQGVIDEYRTGNRVVIIATNDDAEARRCDREICVTDFSS